MTEEKHCIECIETLFEGKTSRKFLKPGERPEAEFETTEEEMEAREYCGIHGL